MKNKTVSNIKINNIVNPKYNQKFRTISTKSIDINV